MRRRCATLAAAALIGGLSACYSAEFDPALDEVYACTNDGDCSETFACVNLVCIDTRGPVVEILGPEEFQSFPFPTPPGEEEIRIILSGVDLILIEPGGANVEGQGHVDVLLDGKVVETLTSGSLAGSPATEFIPLPAGIGVHRVTAIARKNDGTRYKNPAASETIVFWVDDGLPHVGIRRPVPGDVFKAHPDTGAVSVNMDFVSINFDILNPSNVPMAEQEKVDQGHVHVIFDKGVPDCVKNNDCNAIYVEAVFPSGNGKVNQIGPAANPLSLPPSPPGTYQLAIVAEFSNHKPYFHDEMEVVVWDALDILIVEN